MILLPVLATSTASLAATPTLNRISCVRSTVNYVGTDICRAFLSGTIDKHLYIGLSSNNSAVSVPSSIMVSVNADSKGFAANIASVKSKQTATITAKLGGIAKTFTIYLVPPTAGAASLGINATSIGFGSVMVNTPQEQTVTLTSTGSSAVTVNSASVSGTGFALSGAAFPATLNPGQSRTLQVQFDPTKAGTFTGQLTVNCSVSTKTIPLSGVGTAHQVELSWSAPSATNDPIVGYNVYRSPSATSSYARLNGSTEMATAYMDGTVQSGSSYKYIVKSVDSAGIESPASNATTITVP